jgi:polyisoprenyl-phosphate glycosyltransferase
VVVPIYNEQECLHQLVGRLRAVLERCASTWEVLLVDDGSADASRALVKAICKEDNRFRFVLLSRNFGQQIAYQAGIERAVGGALVLIDADLQDPPELIATLYLKYKEGYEVVIARREQRAGESLWKKATASLFYGLLKRLAKVEIPMDAGDFKIMSRRVASTLTLMTERNKFLRGQIAWMGLTCTEVPYAREARKGGKSHYTTGKMLRLALDAITSFSDFPLRVASIMGFVVAGTTFLVALYALYSRFVLRDYVPGWTSLILTVLFLGGVQLACLGIIGEYIGRISQDVKGRPLYLVEEEG